MNKKNVYLVYFSDRDYVGNDLYKPVIDGKIFKTYDGALNYAKKIIKGHNEDKNNNEITLELFNFDNNSQLVGTDGEYNVVWIQKKKLKN